MQSDWSRAFWAMTAEQELHPDMGFAMESQESKELPFALLFRKNK